MRYLLLALVFWSGSAAIKYSLLDPSHEARRNRISSEDFLVSPGPELLQFVSFEHGMALSDVTWLSIVQELGKEEPSWERIARWAEISTDFDRKYFTVYHSAGIVLSVYGDMVDRADALFLKGWTELPEHWELPMMLGYDAYFVRGDAFTASEFMQEAAQIPGSPRFLPALAGRMRFHAGDSGGAIAMLESMLPFLSGGALRDAKERIKILQQEPMLQRYDRACQRHLAEYGQKPTPRRVFELGWVPDPPVDFTGEPLRFDNDCITRSELISTREFEAADRMGSARDGELAPGLDVAPALD